MNTFIMIVGCPRSGTTLIRNMLTSHPDIFIFPQTQFVNKIWGARHLVNYKTNRDKLLQVVAEDRAVKKSNIDLFSAKIRHRNHFSDYFQEYMDFISDYNFEKKKIIGDKTPMHTMFIDIIARKMNANLKTVAVIRDSRAVIASMIARKLVGTVERGAAIWNSYTSQIVKLAEQYQDDLLVLTYEDLISDSAGVGNEISDFLQVEFSNDMIDIKENNSSYSQSASKGIYANSMNIWKEKLSPKEIATITCLTRKNLTRFGYESLPAPVRLSPASYLRYWLSLVEECILLTAIKLGIFPTPFLTTIKKSWSRP